MATKKTTAKKTPAKKAPAKKVTVQKKATAKKAPVKPAKAVKKPVVNKLKDKVMAAKKIASKKPSAKPAPKTTPKTASKKPVASAPAAASNSNRKPAIKPAANSNNFDFSKGDYVVYAVHGVGQVEGVETQTIGGMEVNLYVVSFEKDRMRLKIPVMKAESSGLRKLCTGTHLNDALKTLKGRSRIRRTMWSRRAQEYETKINSGDPIAIAEVLRDLKRSNDETEQSYSERQIYQSALERLAREVAVVEKISDDKATEKLEKLMGKKKKKSSPAAEQDNRKAA